MTPTASTTAPKLAYSVSGLAVETTLSKQTLYAEIEAGRLRAVRIRGRLVIPADAVAEWLQANED